MARLRGNTAVLLLLLLLLGLALVILDYTHLFQPAENVVAQLLFPLQRAFYSLGARVADLGNFFQELESLEARNRELQSLVDQLVIENVRLREAEIENATLREQLGFKEANPDFRLVAAEVIGRDPSNFLGYILIDRGSSDGMKSNMPVVTSQGLVGRIVEVYPRSSRVLLITDPSSSVNALIQSSRATGVVQGQPDGSLAMRYIQQGEEVKVGDLVLTSGLGGYFPKRLIVGQVTSVRQRDVEPFQEAEVKPTVQFNHLEIVLIITDFEANR